MEIETIDELLAYSADHMNKSLEHFERELLKIRAGKASPSMLDTVKVDYYGSMTPLAQVATVASPDSRTITVTPWEKHMIPVIEKAIRDANLGFNPGGDGEKVVVPIPMLTEERRLQLVRQAKQEEENAKVAIRKIRQDANHKLKEFQKDGEPEDAVKRGEKKVQELTDEYGNKVDEVFKHKETEIMTV